MSLYRKYRPKNFSQVIGQDHVKKTLANALKFNEVVHGYLFSGSRGIGKTSIARILAMALNCEERSSEGEPCGQCLSCKAIVNGSDLNVVEIDAASNRGIDEIRALRDSVAVAPSGGKKKVYIIDEVHMLTKEAFNALLKTLEEPPAHAIFVLATTEVERIPDTIISRIQHFEFKRATVEQLKAQLTEIAKQEKLKIDPKALDLIINQANGGFRDSLTILNQLQALGESKITAKVVETNLGLVSSTELSALVNASLQGRAQDLQVKISALNEAGYKPSTIIDSLLGIYRLALWQINGVALPTSQAEEVAVVIKELAQAPSGYVERQILRLLQAKQQLRWSPIPMLPIELAMLPEAQSRSAPVAPQQKQVAQSAIEKEAVSHEEKVLAVKPAIVPAAKVEPAKQTLPPTKKSIIAESRPARQEIPEVSKINNDSVETPSVAHGQAIEDEVLKKAWPEIIAEIRLENASLGALLRSCQLTEAANGRLVIDVPFSFYGDRITDTKNEPIIIAKVKARLGVSGKIFCQLAQAQASSPPPPPPPMIKDQSANQAVTNEENKPGNKESVLEAAQEIFGVRAE